MDKKYFLGCISSCIGEIFPKIHILHLTPVSNKKFGCGRSVTKGTLLGEQSTFLGVSRLRF